MKFQFRAFALLLAASLLFSNCAMLQENKWLKTYHRDLTSLAASSKTEEEKLDGLLTAYVELMRQGLKFANPVKGAKFIGKFQEQNKEPINQILSKAGAWHQKMSLKDNVELGLRLAKKPYLKDFILLAPKFKKKYKEYKAVTEMTARITGGYGKLGEKVLGIL